MSSNRKSSKPAGSILRVGLVGTGEIAQTTHLPTLGLMSHLYRVVALCDVSKDSLAHCAKKFNVGKVFTDFSAMAADPDIDVIMILTADEYHADFAVEAAKNGKAVFIEKPMALTYRDAQRIIEAERKNNVTIFIGYMRRYAPAFQVAKDIVSSLKTIDYVRVRDIIGFNSFFVDQSATFPLKFSDFPKDANTDRLARGSSMAEEALRQTNPNMKDTFTYRLLAGLGSHDLSAMRELLGPPKSCIAASRNSSGYFINALLEYEGFTVSYETGIDGVALFDAHTEVYGDGKRVKIDYDTPYIKGLPITVTVSEADANGQYQKRIIRPTYKDAYTVELEELHKAITEGAPVKTTPEDALQDLLTIDMIMSALMGTGLSKSRL